MSKYSRLLEMKSLFIISLVVILYSLSFVSSIPCESNEEKEYLFSTTLDATSSNYVTSSPIGLFYGLNTPTTIPSNTQLVNLFNLTKGKYIVEIGDSAWSRWIDSSANTVGWGGGPGLVWESTASTVYNSSGILKIVRFGGEGLFYTQDEAEVNGLDNGYEFSHGGGNISILLTDAPIDDNRAYVVVDVYSCKLEEQEFDLSIDNGSHIPDPAHEGDFIAYNFVSHNTGNSIVHNVPVEVYLDGELFTPEGMADNWDFGAGDVDLGIHLGELDAGWHEVTIKIDPENVITETDENNNIYTYCFEVFEEQEESDLYINNGLTIPSKIYEDDTFKIKIDLHNTGDFDFENVPVRIYLDGELLERDTLDYPTGRTNDYVVYRNLGPLDAGAHTFRIVTDYGNTIDETNENNNNYEFRFTVYEECFDNNGINYINSTYEGTGKTVLVVDEGTINLEDINLEKGNLAENSNKSSLILFLFWGLIMGIIILLILIVLMRK